MQGKELADLAYKLANSVLNNPTIANDCHDPRLDVIRFRAQQVMKHLRVEPYFKVKSKEIPDLDEDAIREACEKVYKGG